MRLDPQEEGERCLTASVVLQKKRKEEKKGGISKGICKEYLRQFKQ